MTALQKVVERKIYFYRITTDQFMGQPLPLNPEDIVKHIKKLAASGRRSWTNPTTNITTGCWVDDENAPQRLRLGTVRRSGLPHIEHAGILSPLPEDEIIELAHVVFFPDQIVGSEFNPYGPRLPRLGSYLSATTFYLPIHFEPLLREDAAKKLEKLEPIRVLRLKIRPAFARIIAQADQDLGSAFEAAKRAGNAEEIELVLKPRAYSRGWLANRLISTVRTLARREEVHDDVLQFEVKGLNTETGLIDTVDVLSDQLIVKKAIIVQDHDTESLNSKSAYAAIEATYNDLRDQLRLAAGVST
jgi:hypothetical protein